LAGGIFGAGRLQGSLRRQLLLLGGGLRLGDGMMTRFVKPLNANIIYKVIAGKGFCHLGETKSGDNHLLTWPLGDNDPENTRIIISEQLKLL
jgi:hypothetical protein